MAEIIISKSAISDLEIILEFISADSEKNAENFLKGVLQIIDNLQNFNFLGRVVVELNDKSIRELIYGNYRVIYKIKSSELIVIIAIHSSFRDFNVEKIML